MTWNLRCLSGNFKKGNWDFVSEVLKSLNKSNPEAHVLQAVKPTDRYQRRLPLVTMKPNLHNGPPSQVVLRTSLGFPSSRITMARFPPSQCFSNYSLQSPISFKEKVFKLSNFHARSNTNKDKFRKASLRTNTSSEKCNSSLQSEVFSSHSPAHCKHEEQH